MRKPAPNPIMRLLPSLTDVAFLMPVLFLFLRLDGAKYLLGDGDTGWHLRTGEWILQNGRVPDRDIFSFTKSGEPWYAWEWLWDVALAWLYQRWGMEAVVLASVLAIALTAAVLYRLVLRTCGDALIAIIASFLATSAASIHWLARPHVFSLLLVVIFYSVLERAREGRYRLLIALPLLTVLWTNVHAGFFVGIVLLLTYAAGETAVWLVSPDREARMAALRRTKPYLVCAAGCVLASLINPYTYRLHFFIARFLADGAAFGRINEYLSMDFQHPASRYFEAMLLLGAVSTVWSVYRGRFTHAMLVTAWAHLALFSARNVPIYCFLAAPVAALTAKELLERLSHAPVAGWIRRAGATFTNFSAEVGSFEWIGRIYLTSAAGMAVLAALLYLPTGSARFRAEYDTKRYPARAIDLLRQPELSQNIFTTDEWGDYLIYRLYPQVKVFVDGRFDLYGAEFAKQYLDTVEGRHTWEATLRAHRIGTVLLPVNAPLASTLKESRRWRVIYDDGVAIIFRPAAGNPAPGERPEMAKLSAVSVAEFSAIARSRRPTPVIHGSQHPTRGE